MSEKVSPKESLTERTLALFRRIGNVTIVAAGVTAVLYPPAIPVAGAIIGFELAQNAINRRFSDHLKKSPLKTA